MFGRITTLLFIFWFFPFLLQAQSKDIEVAVSEKPLRQAGEVTIQQNERLDILLSRFEKVNRERKGMWGYRIQIFFGSGINAREDAYRAKAKFLSKFNGVPAYVLYQTPFYKVRVGDFRTKREAIILFNKIRIHFREAYLAPPEIIKLPPLK